jgi:glutathione S-transferase
MRLHVTIAARPRIGRAAPPAFARRHATVAGCPFADAPARHEDEMITVHHLNNSRSQRMLWLLEELDVEYQVVRYRRDPQTLLAPPELRAVHPLGKSPVISDGDVTIAESGAIIEYLTGRYGGGRFVPPQDSPERLRYTYWLHYAEGSAISPLLLSLIIRRMPKAPMPFFARPIVRRLAQKVQASYVDPQLKLHFDYMESELGRREWFAGGQFCAADIQMSFPIEAGRARGVVGDARPRLAAFLDRIHARPAYQRALEQGGAFAIQG